MLKNAKRDKMAHEAETVLITGASSGIGREIARWFAANRAADTLLLAARSLDRLNLLKDELSLAGVRAHVFPCDLSMPYSADHLIGSVREAGHQVSILVNNAGLGAAGKFVDVSLDCHRDVIQLNIATLTRLTYLCLPDLLARRGRILQLSSTGAFQPGPYTSVYYASKAYVHSFSLALANELKETGVTVSILCPGSVATRFSQACGKKDLAGAMSPDKVARYACPRLIKRKTLLIPGLKNKLAIFFTKLMPGSWSACFVARIQKPLLCKKDGQETS